MGLNTGQLRRGSELEPRESAPTLAEAGIDKKLSSRAQKLEAHAMGSTDGAHGVVVALSEVEQ